jgi:hypothetical protein
MRHASLAAVGLLLTAMGCEEIPPTPPAPAPTPTTTAAPVAAPTSPADATAAAPTSDSPPATEAAATNAAAVPPAEATTPADSAATPPPVREKAEAGVGVRGDTLGQGIYHTPARAYFQTRERLVFIQVEQALQLFKGAEGRLPQSHQEFMEKIIQANLIQLPELAPGSKYVWDPQKGELMEERPR